MVIIRFPNPEMETRGLGFLTGRFSYRTFQGGDTMVPEEALGHMAMAGLEYSVKGRPNFQGEHAPVRDTAAAPA